MSSTATSKVGLHSKAKGSEKLLLLAYAETAHQDGTYTCPGMTTLRQWTGLSESGVRGVRDRLVEKGEIKIRPELDPTYKTPIIDIVFGDGSNAAIIDKLYLELDPPKVWGVQSLGGPKSGPESSVVVLQESDSKKDSITTTTELGPKSGPPPNLAPLPADETAPTDPVEAAVADLLAEWETRAVSGAYLTVKAETILLRPDWRADIDDIQDYRDAVNLARPDKQLGPAWEASQYQALADRSPNSPRAFRWMDYAPAPPSKPEYWRPWSATTLSTEPPVTVEPEPEPANSDALHLWATALSELALILTEPTFETWFKPVRALALDGDTLVLQAKDDYGRRWLENPPGRLSGEVKRALQRAADRPIAYRVEVQQTREEHAA